MRALSIRQPWLHAILHLGKMVENRDWAGCGYRGPLLLHASKTCTRREYEGAARSIELMRADVGAPPYILPPLDELPRGVFVGIARIASVVEHPADGTVEVEGADQVVRQLDWGRGYVGYRIAGALGLQLADVRQLPPVPFVGQRGLFNAFLGGLPHEGAYQAAWRELGGRS